MDSRFNTRIMKKIKAMAQKIRKISILYPKTSKEFYHQTKFRKSIMSRRCSLKIVLNNFAIFTGKYLCWWYLFFNKNKSPTTLSKRGSNAGVFLVILPNF